MDLPFHAYRRTDPHWDMSRPHLHGELELLFPLTDGDDIFIDNVSYPLRRRSLYLMDAGVPHRSRACPESRYDRCVLHSRWKPPTHWVSPSCPSCWLSTAAAPR